MKGDMKHDKDPEEEFAENVTMALQSSFDFVDESFHQVEVSDIWSKHESKNLLSNGVFCLLEYNLGGLLILIVPEFLINSQMYRSKKR